MHRYQVLHSLRPYQPRFRPFQWSPLPGITISSRYRWKLSTILIFAVIGALLLYLWWNTPEKVRYVTPQPRVTAPIQPPRRVSTPVASTLPKRPLHLEDHEPRFIPSKKRRRRLTPKQRKLVLQAYGHRCADCARVLEEWDTEMDHDIPLAADPYGRHTTAINHISRFVPRCRRCHGYRTWQQRQAGLFKRPLQ